MANISEMFIGLSICSQFDQCLAVTDFDLGVLNPVELVRGDFTFSS